VQPQVVDMDEEVLVAIQPSLLRAPVEYVAPARNEAHHLRSCDAAGVGDAFWPARFVEALPQLCDLRQRNVDREGAYHPRDFTQLACLSSA